MSDALKRMNVSPIGSCALAGTTYDTNRSMEAELLGFDSVGANSLDGVRAEAIEYVQELDLLNSMLCLRREMTQNLKQHVMEEKKETTLHQV